MKRLAIMLLGAAVVLSVARRKHRIYHRRWDEWDDEWEAWDDATA